MKTSTKLVTIFAALATLSLQGAFAQKSDGWKLSKPKFETPTLTWNASGAFDYGSSSIDASLDDIEDFDNLGDKVRVRDLNISLDAMMSIFGARLTLEENSNDLSVDAKDLEEKVRDLYIGIQPATNLVILYGKTDVPFGADQSDNAESDITKLNEQLERKLVAAVQVKPSFIKQLRSIEFAAFSSKSTPDNVKFNDKLDSYSARVIAQLGVVLTQASYMRVDGKEYRASLSGASGVSTQITGPFEVYAELQAIRHSVVNGDINIGTVGVNKALPTKSGKWSAFGEYSRIQASGTSSNARNAGAAGLKYQATKNIALKGALQTHSLAPSGVISTQKDTTAVVSVEVKRAGKDARNEMFTSGATKDADGSQLRDAVSKMRAK